MSHRYRSIFARLASLVILIVVGGHCLSDEISPNEIPGEIPNERKPNVLFLAVDDMKDWVGCLGGYAGTVQTPNIDRLAKRGVLFTNAHCASPKCAPSRAAIMTGQRASRTGLYDNGHWWLPNLPDVVTLPVCFSNAGYRTAAAGKIFHHTAGNHPPNQWDEFLRLTFRNDPWFRGVKLNYPWSPSGPYPSGFPFSGVKGLGHENDWGALPIEASEYDDALSADFAIEFLQRPPGKPFFLACGLFRPHLPWYVPQTYFRMYPLDEIVLPETMKGDLDDLPPEALGFARARRDDFQKIKSVGRWKEAVRAYLASITFADAQLGRVLDALEASTEGENTIVVLWSDHGWHLGEKGHWHKSTLWEEATRVPLVITAPGHTPSVCDSAISLLDLYPTLCELCGIASPPGQPLDGISLVPQLKDPSRKRTRPPVIEYKRGNAAVRDDRYRYIRYRDGGEELYDHASDPHEWHNLAGDAKYRDVVQRMGKWVTKEWADPAATKNAFRFDPEQFQWTEKRTGTVTRGK